MDNFGNSALMVKNFEESLIKWYLLLDWAYCLCFSFKMRVWQNASDVRVDKKLEDMYLKFYQIKALFNQFKN